MSDWLSYAAGDFLLFTPRAYWRLFELHNQAVWPLQAVCQLLGVALMVVVFRPGRRTWRAALFALAALWLWVGWGFIALRYATINWAAVYLAPLFFLQALLMAWFAVKRGGCDFAKPGAGPDGAGIALFLLGYAVILHPLTAWLAGRPWTAAEIFGVAPDPTVFATLALLTVAPGGRFVWLLCAVPLAWCLVSAATLLAMQSWAGWIPLAVACLAVTGRVTWTRRQPG